MRRHSTSCPARRNASALALPATLPLQHALAGGPDLTLDILQRPDMGGTIGMLAHSRLDSPRATTLAAQSKFALLASEPQREFEAIDQQRS